jgi:hypothetical protein
MCTETVASLKIHDFKTYSIRKSCILWDVTPCSPLKVNDFSEEYVASIFSAEKKAKQETSVKQSSALLLASLCFLAWLFFDPEDGGDLFLPNDG